MKKCSLTLYSNITKVSTIIKNIFNIKKYSSDVERNKNKRSVGTHFPIRIKESGWLKMYQSSLYKLLIFFPQTVN